MREKSNDRQGVAEDNLQKLLDSQSTAYDFEKTFDEKWQQITQEVFFRRPKGLLRRIPSGQASLGAVPVDKNKKKKTIDSKFGKVTVNKAHRFCHCPIGFQMNPYLQDLVAFTGQNHVYEDASEQLKKSNGLEISSKQIERITNAYGQIAESSCSELQENLLSEGLLWRKKSTMNPHKLPCIV